MNDPSRRTVAHDPDVVHELVDRAADIITVVDGAGRIVYVNRTAQDVLGWSPQELTGTHGLDLVHPDDLAHATEALAVVLADPDALSTVEMRMRTSTGTYLWFDVLTGGWIDAPPVCGLVLNLREATGRHVAAERTGRRTELDRLVFEVSRRALDATLADVTGALPQLLAHLGELIGADYAFVELTDETDTPVEVASWSAPDVQGPARGGPGELVCPLVVSAVSLGALGVVASGARREWDHDEVTALLAVADAVAVALARERDRLSLAASEVRFRLLAENATDVISLTDADGSLRYVSPAAIDVYGAPPEELIGTRVLSHVHPDDVDAVRASLRPLRHGASTVAFTCRWLTAEGRIVWLENVCRAVRDATGELTAYQASARDVSARKALEDELNHMALHDALTGVANRALFMDRLGAALAARLRSGADVAVLAIDLDGFKEINDHYGHHGGDHALIMVAERLTAAVRASDTVARVGGDEFIVLCTDTSGADGIKLAERLVAAIAESFELAGDVVTVGASIGVATAAADVSLDELLRAADDAMYEAKRAGKGCVRVGRAKTADGGGNPDRQ
jgi:diguanylate cyclase (GGDEF)-like protein/PAS domain S-box-containing protein